MRMIMITTRMVAPLVPRQRKHGLLLDLLRESAGCFGCVRLLRKYQKHLNLDLNLSFCLSSAARVCMFWPFPYLETPPHLIGRDATPHRPRKRLFFFRFLFLADAVGQTSDDGGVGRGAGRNRWRGGGEEGDRGHEGGSREDDLVQPAAGAAHRQEEILHGVGHP